MASSRPWAGAGPATGGPPAAPARPPPPSSPPRSKAPTTAAMLSPSSSVGIALSRVSAIGTSASARRSASASPSTSARPLSAPDLDGGLSPPPRSSTSSAGRTASSFEVVRSGKGGNDGNVVVASRRQVAHNVPRIGLEPAPALRDKGKGRAHHQRLEEGAAASAAADNDEEEEKVEQEEEEEAAAAVGASGSGTASDHDGPGSAGLGIGGLTRTFRSGSITTLASAPAFDQHEVGLVFTPIQPRSPGHPGDSERFSYSSRAVPNDSTRTLRKVASSAAALMSGAKAGDHEQEEPWRRPSVGSDEHEPRQTGRPAQGGSPSRLPRLLAQPDAEQEPFDHGPREAVRHTTHVTQRRDKYGRILINHYMRGNEIGRGVHGVVYKGSDLHCPVVKSAPASEPRPDGADAHAGEGAAADYLTVAIKVVRRDPRHKSLRRSQQQRRRQEAQQHADQEPGSGQLQLLRDVDDKLKREIAIMKRLRHDNIVRLYEVIDDIKSKKVFMILEYMEGGHIAWQDPLTSAPLMTVEQTRKTFRQVVLGLEYLHHQGIIHRDIKPANLLWTLDREIVKISDFGVSHLSSALRRTSSKLSPINEGRAPLTTASDDRALRKTEGSPAFMAPELCCPIEPTPRATPSERDGVDYFNQPPGYSPSGASPRSLLSPPLASGRLVSLPLPRGAYRRGERPPVGKGIDIWALGVTLYCLLFGKTPFDAPNEFELFNVIWNQPAVLPDYMGANRVPTHVGNEYDTANLRERDARHLADLLGQLLEKDPRRRITLDKVKIHAWVLSSLERPRHWIDQTTLQERDTIVVTQDDVANFTRPLSNSATSLKPLGSVRQSLRNAAHKLGLRTGLGNGVRSRTKSVSSTSASACTSPPDVGDLDGSASRSSSLRKARTPVRALSPPSSPVAAQSPNGNSRRTFSLRHGWHSAKASTATLDGRHLPKAVFESGVPAQSGYSTASSIRPSPALTRSNSGHHLHIPPHNRQHSRSSPGSPVPSHHRGPDVTAAYARSASPALSNDDGESRHTLKDALSRVKQKLAKHSTVLHSPSAGGRQNDEARRRASLPSAFDDEQPAPKASGRLSPSALAESEAVIASRIPPSHAGDVFYSDGEGSRSDFDDQDEEDDDSFSDGDFSGSTAELQEEHAIAAHDGTRLRVYQDDGTARKPRANGALGWQTTWGDAALGPPFDGRASGGQPVSREAPHPVGDDGSGLAEEDADAPSDSLEIDIRKRRRGTVASRPDG